MATAMLHRALVWRSGRDRIMGFRGLGFSFRRLGFRIGFLLKRRVQDRIKMFQRNFGIRVLLHLSPKLSNPFRALVFQEVF